LASTALEDLQNLPDEAKAALRLVLLSLRKDAKSRAQKCRITHKAPMAAYFKALSVYCGHTARLLGPLKAKPKAPKLKVISGGLQDAVSSEPTKVVKAG